MTPAERKRRQRDGEKAKREQAAFAFAREQEQRHSVTVQVTKQETHTVTEQVTVSASSASLNPTSIITGFDRLIWNLCRKQWGEVEHMLIIAGRDGTGIVAVCNECSEDEEDAADEDADTKQMSHTVTSNVTVSTPAPAHSVTTDVTIQRVEERCVFCQHGADEISERLLGWRGTWICDECIDSLADALAERRRAELTCSYCGKPQDQYRHITEVKTKKDGWLFNICTECGVRCLMGEPLTRLI